MWSLQQLTVVLSLADLLCCSRVVKAADAIRSVCDGQHVKAWEVCSGGLPSAVKFWSEERLEEAAPQVCSHCSAVLFVDSMHQTEGSSLLKC